MSSQAEIDDLANTLVGSAPNPRPGIVNTILTDGLQIGLYLMAVFLTGYIIYLNFAKGNVFYTHVLVLMMICLVAYQLSAYSKGVKWDHWVTFVIWLATFFTVYGTYVYVVKMMGLAVSNPFVLGLFGLELVLFVFLLISRYTKLNFIKVIAWMIGIFTIFLAFFTMSIWGSIKTCQSAVITSPSDPWYITLSIYAGWVLVAGTFFALGEMKNRSELWYFLLALGCGVSLWISWYATKRCQPEEQKILDQGTTEKEGEEIEKQEVSWIGTSVMILIGLAYFSLFTGSFMTAVWYGFMGMYILDGCSPEGDYRRGAFALAIPLSFLAKAISMTL